MITGLKYWNDRSRTYYIQTNNPTEEILRKRKDGSWLESCGPSAGTSCLTARGDNVKIICPGTYEPQPEEVLMDSFNDPVLYEAFKKIRPETPPKDYFGNRIPQFYTVAVPAVFGVKTEYIECKVTFEKILALIISGRAVQICLKNPGHYIAVVACDTDKRELIFNDSWPNRFPDGNGFNRRMQETELLTNVKAFMIVYG